MRRPIYRSRNFKIKSIAMRKKYLIECLVVLCVTALLLSSCFINRTGSGTPLTIELSAIPNYICSGDDVVLSWNVSGVSRSASFCSNPDGGISPRTNCSDDGDCPVGARCVDGLCVLSSLSSADLSEVDFGSGCLETTSVTITAIPGRGGVTVSADPRISGSVTVNPLTSTTYSAIVTALTRMPSDPSIKSVTVVPVEGEGLPFEKPINFGSPLCSDPLLPLSINLEELEPEPIIGSEHVQIISVRNDSPYDVMVETRTPSRGPVFIGSGMVEPTGALNGVTGRDWILSPILDEDSIPSDEDCERGTTSGGSEVVIPPAVLTISLVCRP